MEKKGFFKQNKVTMLFLVLILALDIIMFIPAIFHAHTAVGTSVQFIFVNIILVVAPSLALVDAFIKNSAEKKGK